MKTRIINLGREGDLKAGPLRVRIENDRPGASIYYTLDGSEPTTASMLYDGSILELSTPAIIRARAYTDEAFDLRGASELFSSEIIRINEGFENDQVGLSPISPDVVEDGPGTVRVIDEAPASGQHCVRLLDHPQVGADYNPHLYYVVDIAEAEVQLDYQVRLAPDAHLDQICRDWSGNPFVDGPHLIFDRGVLTAPGLNRSAEIPTERWIKVAITLDLTTPATQSWSVRMEWDDAVQVQWDDLPLRETFNRLTWFGFLSFSEGIAAIDLDDIELHMN